MIPYERALAVLAVADQQPERALAHLREAARLAQELGLPGEAWPALAALAELPRSRGEAELARPAAARAAEIVRLLAAGLDDERLRLDFLCAAGP